MSRTRLGFVVAIGVLLVGTTAFAHHSFAAYYDEGQRVSIEGEVVAFELRSPHAWVYVMAPDKDGVMRKFGAEWANPRRLSQAGIDAQTIRTGDRVIVDGFQKFVAGDVVSPQPWQPIRRAEGALRREASADGDSVTAR